MDANTFDRLTRAAARNPSRRTALRLLAGGLLGGVLAQHGLTRSLAAQAADRDGDGLFDDDETGFYGTDPDNPDSDGDGSSDGEEVYYDTDPLDANSRPQPTDSDGDGLYDQDELEVYGTDPNNPDTDGDGVSDGQEVFDGTDPRQGTCPAGTSACGDRCAGPEGAPCAGMPLDVCCSQMCDYLVGGGTCASCNGQYCASDADCCSGGAQCINNRCGGCLHRGVVCTADGHPCCDSDCSFIGGGGVCLSTIGGRCKHDADCEACYSQGRCQGACADGFCII